MDIFYRHKKESIEDELKRDIPTEDKLDFLYDVKSEFVDSNSSDGANGFISFIDARIDQLKHKISQETTVSFFV